MLHTFRDAPLGRSLSLMGRALPLVILPALFACERSAADPLLDTDLQASAFPGITGDYSATGVANLTTELGGVIHPELLRHHQRRQSDGQHVLRNVYRGGRG